jgi:hypothetical protein
MTKIDRQDENGSSAVDPHMSIIMASCATLPSFVYEQERVDMQLHPLTIFVRF